MTMCGLLACRVEELESRSDQHQQSQQLQQQQVVPGDYQAVVQQVGGLGAADGVQPSNGSTTAAAAAAVEAQEVASVTGGTQQVLFSPDQKLCVHVCHI